MKRVWTAALVLCLIVGAGILLTAAQQKTAKPAQPPKVDEKTLAPQYQDFLKLTAYIILAKEKEVFLRLSNDRDRNIFIDTFWKQRDPTPGTPDNEFKEEHTKRFNHANTTFGRGTGKEGWRTDRGKFYIILGPPPSIERFYGTLGLHPLEVWYYYGDSKKNLPNHFGLIFFQKSGVGEFRLYDPVSDGPQALTYYNQGIGMDEYEKWYDLIRDLAPTLADVAISIIPEETPIGYAPSPRNAIIMADILESPKQNVNASYATHFLDYKGMVSTEYQTNYVESEGVAAVIRDPATSMNFLHFAIVPKSISVDYYEPRDQYFCNFTLTASLRLPRPEGSPEEEQIIFQYSREFPFYFSPDEVGSVKANGLSIEDSFPMAEGTYKLLVLLQNSVGQEFSVFEKQVTLATESNAPSLAGPYLGYKFQEFLPTLHVPFKVFDKKLVVDPKNTFAAADSVALAFNVLNATSELWNDGRVRLTVRSSGAAQGRPLSLDFPLRNHPFQKIIPMSHALAAAELPPEYYEASLELLDGAGQVIDQRTGTFIISPAGVLGHPVAHARGLQLENRYLFYNMLGTQYEKVNESEKAEAWYQKAYEMRPDYKKAAVDYISFLLKTKKYEKALTLIAGLRDRADSTFEYYVLTGNALLGMNEYERAIVSYLEANKIYNSDVGLLNNLGFCYYMTGQKTLAREVLSVSLRLNPNQDRVKKLLQDIENNK